MNSAALVLRKRWRLAIVLLLTVAGLILGIGIAQAHLGAVRSDDASLTYNESLIGNLDIAFRNSRLYDVNPTDVTTVYRSNVHSGVMTDINAYATNLVSPNGGDWACQVKVAATSHRCAHGHLRMDTDPSTMAVKNYVACQELGHSLGLNHVLSGATCMNKNSTASSVFDQHDKDVINVTYWGTKSPKRCRSRFEHLAEWHNLDSDRVSSSACWLVPLESAGCSRTDRGRSNRGRRVATEPTIDEPPVGGRF